MNPILSSMMGSRSNSALSTLSNIKQIFNGNPAEAMNALMQRNPQFRAFVQQNQGKSPEQIAQAYGVDMNQLRSLLR